MAALLRTAATLFVLITAIRCRGPLLVEPSFLLIEEDWPVGKSLPVTVCPGAARILSGDGGKHFSVVKINSSCSALSLNKQLDADKEGGQSFSLVLAGRRQARATLDIQVVDVNDNAPAFQGAPSVLSIREDTPEGSVVAKLRVADPDTGVGGLVRFSLDNDEFFGVDKQKCSDGECWTSMRLKKELDFETRRTHEVTVIADDGDPLKGGNSANHTISIQVVDVQDQSPVWKSELKAVATAVGQKILKVLAVDGDEGNTNDIRYSIEENEFLSVDDVTGAVTVVKMPKDTEERTFTVTAKEQDSTGQASAAVLTVTFASSPVSAAKTELCSHVSAKIKAGSSAFDSPLRVNFNRPVSTLTVDGTTAFQVTLDNNIATVTVTHPELIQEDLSFNLKTEEGDCLVRVEVISDPEDNQAPVFEHDSFLFYVVENHRPGVLGSVKATKQVTYSLLGQKASLFSISEQGELKSLQPIDREQVERIDLVVRATDSHGKWTDCPGKVVVKDVNDNSPRFVKEVYEVEVDEERSMKQRILAVDPDLGENGTIIYALEETPDGVPIDFSAGILFIGKLDRDTMQSDNLTITVRATDKGQPPRSSIAKVVITVRDINDNYPVFTNARYSLVLDANISPGGVVGAVSAEDADATAPNNYIRYFTDDSRFRVTDGGEIIYTGGSGTEEKPLSKDTAVEFTATATDGGDPPRNATTAVAVNEHKKALQSELTTELSEVGEKQKIAWANARMPGYTYELVRATAKGFKDEEVRKWVEVDKETGEITTKRSLTPEVVKRIRLSISMRKGKREIPVELIINVVDSDSSPSFRKENYRAVLPEDTPVSSRVLQVKAHPEDSYKPIFKNGSVFTVTVSEDASVGTVLDLPYPLATDEDEGDNARLEYVLIDNSGLFSIDKKNSTITLRKSLDYETQRAHSLPVRCSDGVHEVFAAVTVQVLDANDNRPQLLNADLQQLSVAEDASTGTVVTSLAATDADEGGKQTVKMSTNHSLFGVDEGGRMVVSQTLKGKAGERLCGVVIARDSGEPLLETTSPFCVTVYPAVYNTHSPLIVSPKQNSIHYFDENVQLDELLRIKVLDEGPKENITFSLDTEFKRDWEAFRVNASGALLARAPFDFEKKAVHELKVKACRATNCSSVHLFISVNDRNDNCPIFPRGDILLSVTENDRSQTPRNVGRFPPALDSDFHADNTKVCYATNSPLFFFTDPSLPVLYTNTTFDREQTAEHRITITAYDCLLSCRDPFKPANASLMAVIKVTDVNDNFPKFSQRNYQTTVIQGQASPGSHLTTVVASDPDEEKDGLRYLIKGAVRAGKMTYPSGTDGPLSLDPATGEVTANEALRESSYSFTAVVVDGAKHEDTATVTISVVTYTQQAELLFDAPFDFIVRNEKHIVSLLTEATQYRAVVDRCRQNANFTLVLAHFVDGENHFVDVDNAITRLSSSNSSARRELRSAYGLRDPVVPVTGISQERTLQAIAGAAVVAAMTALLMVICMCCRRRNKYDGKLRSISQQAVLHQATMGRPPPKVMNPSLFCVDGVRLAAPPPPPLQSTEL